MLIYLIKHNYISMTEKKLFEYYNIDQIKNYYKNKNLKEINKGLNFQLDDKKEIKQKYDKAFFLKK